MSERANENTNQAAQMRFNPETKATIDFLTNQESSTDKPLLNPALNKLVELSQSDDYDNIRIFAESLVTECPVDQHRQLFLAFEKLLSSNETGDRVFANSITDKILEQFGFDQTDIDYWVRLKLLSQNEEFAKITDTYNQRAQAKRDNLIEIFSLELRQPGIVKYYVDNFHLRSFESLAADKYVEWYTVLPQNESLSGESDEQKWRRLIRQSLIQLGLSEQTTDKMFQTWENCSKEGNSFITTCKNYSAIFEIFERHSEEAIQVLTESFGIHNFSRYDIDMLIKQYEERDEAGNFSLVLYPKSDYNEGFAQDKQILSQLASDSQDVNTPLRVIESGSLPELISRVSKLIKTAQGKIKLAVVGGHGSLTDIRLGGKGNTLEDPHPRSKIDIVDILRPEAGLFKQWFTDDATIILNSCYTGDNEGVGQNLSEQFKLRIIAPATETALTSIELELNPDESFTIHAEYKDQDSKREFIPHISE